MPDTRAALAQLFRTAGTAHHHAFASTNGDDPDWPEWYARYLAPAVPELIDTSLAPDVLADALRRVDAEQRKRAPTADWATYYADWFLARYSGEAKPQR